MRIIGSNSGRLAIVFSLGLFLNAGVSQAENHPRLFFSKAELPELIKQSQGSKALQFQRLRAWGDAHLDELPPTDLGNEERHHESSFSAVTNFGLLYQLTGEKKYFEAGHRWIEKLLQTPIDPEGDFLMGFFCASLGQSYDLFYDALSETERSKLKAKLISALEATRYGAENSWWGGIYTHHDFWIPMAFLGLASMSVQGEYEGADAILNYAVSEISEAMDILGEQGYWPEGVADWSYGMAPSLMFFDALKRSGGKDFYQYPWLQKTARVRLTHWLPGDQYMYLGDSFPSGRYGSLGSVTSHLLMNLATHYDDGQAQWLALREAVVDSSAPELNSLENPYSYATQAPIHDRERHGLAWQFLWYNPSIKPTAPDGLPLDNLYKNWDTVIFRAGWGEHDPVLAFSGGHLLGRAGTKAWRAGKGGLPDGLAHTHQNAGSIYLWADGRFPLTPPGFGGRDGRFHSTVMVNGHGQMFDAGYTGKVTSFESSKSWGMATMDLSSAYPEAVLLKQFKRTLVYLKPRTVVMFDDLVGGGDNYLRRYEWLLHTDPAQAQWQAKDDSFQAVSTIHPTAPPLLLGKVYPSYRYYFERQSMDRPDGKPLNRALSVTIIGRMRAKVQIASLLHVPAPGKDTGWLHRVECIQNDDAVTMIVPDGPYFVIRTGPKGRPSRTVIFARQQELTIPEKVPDKGLLLVSGLAPGSNYRLAGSKKGEQDRKISGRTLVRDPQGKLTVSENGNLILRRGNP